LKLDSLFFHSWQTIYRTFLVGIPAYFILIFFLRVSGKRTLSKMNAFDLVITVALGSTLATILLSEQVALAEGVVGLAVLVLLQYIITFTSVRFDFVRKIIKGSPTLLFYHGEFLEDVMTHQRVLNTEVHAAVREQGVADMNAVEAVVLETDGSFTVIKKNPQGRNDALAGIPGYEQRYDKKIEL